MRGSRREPERRDLSDAAPPAAGPRAYAALALLPAIAILVYAVALALGPALAADLGVFGSWGVYVGTSAAGFVMFALSLRKTMCPRGAIQAQVAVS